MHDDSLQCTRLCKSAPIRWRIGYQIATPDLAKDAKTAAVERAVDHPSHWSHWSDLSPVTVAFGE